MKAVAQFTVLQVALLLSVACSAFALPDAPHNDFTSLFEDKDVISDSATDADVAVLVSMLVRGPRRLLKAVPATHDKNATSHHSRSPQPSEVPLSPSSTEGDSSAVLPACRNITEMTPACSAALQEQQSKTVFIIVIVCAVGAFLIILGVRFPLGFMKWTNIGQFGAATAGPCVMVVYYAPVLTNDAADNLRWLIRDLRDLGQLGVPEAAPFGHNKTIYGAVAGLQLSMDAEDIQVLLQKCTMDGLAVHLPSGCWLEGTRDAALAPNKGTPPRDRIIQYRV
ncbi:hypothetical protein COCOBI_15-1020 [Coccomyxa sp. Obi]|nr:hypothetical protein COCOBI_15-1020 [Coccomyxa sp. Obi]